MRKVQKNHSLFCGYFPKVPILALCQCSRALVNHRVCRHMVEISCNRNYRRTERFGKRLYSSPCHRGLVVLDHGSEGAFGIPLCTARYIWLLQINSCLNSSRLQKNKSIGEFPAQETLHHSCHGSLPPPDSSKPVWLQLLSLHTAAGCL